jgi:hypothetical protein
VSPDPVSLAPSGGQCLEELMWLIRKQNKSDGHGAAERNKNLEPPPTATAPLPFCSDTSRAFHSR